MQRQLMRIAISLIVISLFYGFYLWQISSVVSETSKNFPPPLMSEEREGVSIASSDPSRPLLMSELEDQEPGGQGKSAASSKNPAVRLYRSVMYSVRLTVRSFEKNTQARYDEANEVTGGAPEAE